VGGHKLVTYIHYQMVDCRWDRSSIDVQLKRYVVYWTAEDTRSDKFEKFHCVLIFFNVSKILWLFPSQWGACAIITTRLSTVVLMKQNSRTFGKHSLWLAAQHPMGYKRWNYNVKLFIWAPLRPDRYVIATIVIMLR